MRSVLEGVKWFCARPGEKGGGGGGDQDDDAAHRVLDGPVCLHPMGLRGRGGRGVPGRRGRGGGVVRAQLPPAPVLPALVDGVEAQGAGGG